MGRWYRSKEKLVGHNNQYAGYLTNKKWHLNEVQDFSFKHLTSLIISESLILIFKHFKEMAKHLLYFQQV